MLPLSIDWETNISDFFHHPNQHHKMYFPRRGIERISYSIWKACHTFLEIFYNVVYLISGIYAAARVLRLLQYK